MNAYDIVFIALIALLGLRGLWRGLIREVAMMFGVIGGLILARLFRREAAPLFEPYLKNVWLTNAAAFAAIFIAVYAAGGIASRILRRALRRAGIGRFERLAGGAFGAFEGAVLVGVFLILVRGVFGPLEVTFLRDSLSAPLILEMMDFLSGLVSPPLV